MIQAVYYIVRQTFGKKGDRKMIKFVGPKKSGEWVVKNE